MLTYGAVSYLNARPLVEGLAPLVLDTPARLVEAYADGGIDVALLPVAAAQAAGLARVGSLGVAADGAVDSVLLFLRCTAREVKTLALDPASRTSRLLAQIVLREVYGRELRVLDPSDAAAETRSADAELVIGDAALVRRATGEAHLDLAEEWTRFTGLPFVFAAWYGESRAEPQLEEAYARGRKRFSDYARNAGLGLAPDELERYLRERIRFRIGPREEEGLARFHASCRSLGLL